jgi:glutamyl-tRNA reductase
MTTNFPLAVIGCDFRIAPSRARSQLVTDEDEETMLARQLLDGGWAKGVAFLNTCNRNEWIVASDNPQWAAELLQSRMQQRLDPEFRNQIKPYIHVGEAAATHLFRVALGQESLVVGERQIAGQLFKALAMARANDHTARILNDIEATVGRLIRAAKRQGCVSGSAIGVHSLAIAWLRQHLPLDKRNVAVVGLGTIGRLVETSLHHEPSMTPTVFNRTVQPKSVCQPLSELSTHLPTLDAVIFCSAARQPIFNPASYTTSSPLVVLDLGIPEQVSPGKNHHIRHVGFDDLVTWHHATTQRQPDSDTAVIRALIERAILELNRAQSPPLLAPFIDRVRTRSRTQVRTELHSLLDQNLTSVSARQRGKIEEKINDLLDGHTENILQTISDYAPTPSQEK